MSIYTDCREAAFALLADEALQTEGIPYAFTELDVIVRAAMASGTYSEEEMRIAQRDASQVMGEMFRTRRVARYGPVSLIGLGFEHQDYARIATKIIYADPERAPKELQTPNGVFSRLMSEDDTITRVGRRLGTNRSDLIPWDQQNILGTLRRNDPRPTSADQREVMRLKAENAALHERVHKLESENYRLRTLRVGISREEVENIVGSLSARVAELADKVETN